MISLHKEVHEIVLKRVCFEDQEADKREFFFFPQNMSMLDLNVDNITHDHADGNPSTCVQKGLQLKSFLPDISDSKTSNSSVWNPLAEEDSSNSSSDPFLFSLLKKERDDGSEFHHTTAQEAEIVTVTTRTLFPVISDRGGRMASDFNKLGLWGKKSTQWQNNLNLSFPEPGEQKGLRTTTLQQKQPQARKRRRGPKSRSSQYRGVTFYRRTGRWESHIWYGI